MKSSIDHYKKNTKKYFNYHQDIGHTSEECFNLKILIETLIKNGELDRFIKEDKEQRRETQNNQISVRGEINTIFRGMMLGFHTKSSKKHYAKEVYNLYRQINCPKQKTPIACQRIILKG